jgi:GTPase SAR1 family protein
MFKNILIIGPGRAGKTTLARMIHQKYGYSVIRIDDIVTAMEAFPSLEISWDGDATKIATQMAPFLRIYLKELSEGNAFYGGCKTVVEGSDIDFDQLIPYINKRKYLLIGLTYNQVSKEELFLRIRQNDTEDDWTYYLTDAQLEAYCAQFVEKNKFFTEKFKEYSIPAYDTSVDREAVLTDIVEQLADRCHWEPNTPTA